jgi:hypothetical protein
LKDTGCIDKSVRDNDGFPITSLDANTRRCPSIDFLHPLGVIESLDFVVFAKLYLLSQRFDDR